MVLRPKEKLEDVGAAAKCSRVVLTKRGALEEVPREIDPNLLEDRGGFTVGV